MSNQSDAASILCKPIGAKLWLCTSSRPTTSTSVNTTWHTACTKFYGACRNYADFLNMIPILRRFRIISHQRQAALHSSLFNYTPLVNRGTHKNKQLTIVKPTQNGINRNKYTFSVLKSWEPPKNSKTSRVPQLGQVLYIFVNIFEIYLVRQSL